MKLALSLSAFALCAALVCLDVELPRNEPRSEQLKLQEALQNRAFEVGRAEQAECDEAVFKNGAEEQTYNPWCKAAFSGWRDGIAAWDVLKK
jgi:hypothetical protein